MLYNTVVSIYNTYLCFCVVLCTLLCFSMYYCCVVLCIVYFVLFYVLFVCKCVLPLGDNPIAVNKNISYIISTTSTSDVVGQHNKIGGITFGAALVVKYKWLGGTSCTHFQDWKVCTSHPEIWDIRFLCNVGMYLSSYKASYPTSP